MSKFVKTCLASALMLAACSPQEDVSLPPNEYEIFEPAPLMVYGTGQVEAAPDIAIVIGTIEITDDNHGLVMSQIADIMNSVQTIADTAETEMSYTQLTSQDKFDEACLKRNQIATKRFQELVSDIRHNTHQKRFIEQLEIQKKSTQTDFDRELKQNTSRLRKLNKHRDIPDIRRDIIDLEEEIDDENDDHISAMETLNTRRKTAQDSLRDSKPRLAQESCLVTEAEGYVQFTARIHPADLAAGFMTQFTAKGVTKIDLFGYDFSDYDAVYQEAAQRAVTNARAKAKLIAGGAGSKLQKVKSFSISQPTRFGRFGPQSKIVTAPRAESYISIPAVYETYSEAVVVQEASTELITVPATWETVTETIVIQPQSIEYVTIPPTYETVIETVVVQEGRFNNGIRIPPVTKNVSRRVIKTPASTVEKIVPAVTRQIQKRVVKTPARTQERVVPSVTKMETRRRVKTPARTLEQEAPGNPLQGQLSDAQSSALKRSVLSGPQTVTVIAQMGFDYETGLDDVRFTTKP